MEECSQLHLPSPPSSLPDGLLAPRVTTPPIPKPRKSASFTLTSTPKHPLPLHHQPLTNGHEELQSRGSRRCSGMQRAPSLDSASYCKDTSIPAIPRTKTLHSDSESEEDISSRNSTSKGASSRSNGVCTSTPHSKPTSYSLPNTPRVTSSSSTSNLNGGLFNGSLISCLAPLHNAPAYMVLERLDRAVLQDSTASTSSQYVTCISDKDLQGNSSLLNESSVFGETREVKLPGAIDYSSLPLPHGESGSSLSHDRGDISRHYSEPCIPHTNRKAFNLTGSPQKLNYKYKNKEGTAVATGMHGIKENGLSDGDCDGIDALEVQWRFIQTLTEELNKSKTANRRLVAELHQARMEIQVLKATVESYADSGLQPGAITEMVGQIHAAQKVRDESMMARIKLANEERDAAITHARTLMEKLNLSQPASQTDQRDIDRELTSGGTNSLSSSPKQCDHRPAGKNSVIEDNVNFPIYSSSSSSAHYQGITIVEMLREERDQALARLAACEEEFKALRGAKIHHEASSCSKGGCILPSTVKQLECLSNQLQESENCRHLLSDQCARLEHLVSSLRKKINGVTSEAIHDGTSLTLVDLTLHDEHLNTMGGKSTSNNLIQTQYNSRNMANTSANRSNPSTGSSDGDGRDSLSSLDSVETASVSSWRRGDPRSVPHSCEFSQNGNVNSETDRQNIPGVTIVGPITEL
ncbi:uncharacterized protein LOC143025528 isoform X2 [Oratosquilla oratoria]|uniref:uncharacterized protein LOC143025528 isoform X2 n=1 Tax=Oratosquilla oratoria TaxID=337810 RepID=UPI003F7593CF